MLSKVSKYSRTIASLRTVVQANAFPIAVRAIHIPVSKLSVSRTSNVAMTQRFMSSSKEFSKVLSEELAAETGETEELDPDFEDVKKVILKDFKIIDNPGEAAVSLTREMGTAKITIIFDCQDKEEAEPNLDEIPEDKDFNEEDLEAEVGVPFQVIVEKKGHRILVDALAAQELEIKNVQYAPADKDLEDDKLYGGPVFDDLDDRVREEMFRYLEELGVNNDLSYFILSYASKKEQKEYELWLSNLAKFTAE